MTSEQQSIKAEHRIKLEKRNDAGELYETIELSADEHGAIIRAEVIQRVAGLAPPEAYTKLQEE